MLQRDPTWLLILSALSCPALPHNLPAQDDPKVDVADQGRLITEAAFADLTYTSESKLAFARESMQFRIENQIRAVHRHCELTDEQKSKLRLAGQGDFRQWQDWAEEVRAKYAGRPLSFEERRLADIEMSFVRNRPADEPLDPNCLFQQTLRRIISPEQRSGYFAYQRAQRLQQLERAWKSWEYKPLEMNLPQATRDKLNALLMEHAPPLPRNGQYAKFIVVLQLAEMEERVKPLLTESEWDQFQQARNHARAMERYLRAFQLWPVAMPNENDDATSSVP
jgi:hypothetical protein